MCINKNDFNVHITKNVKNMQVAMGVFQLLH